MAGLIASDFTDHIGVDQVFAALHTEEEECHTRYPCIPTF